MYKVAKFKHNNEEQLEDQINDWIDQNPDHSFVSMTTIDNRGKMLGVFFLSFVVFKDHSSSVLD